MNIDYERIKANQNSQAFPSGADGGLTKREYLSAIFLQSQISNGVYVNQGAIQVAIEHADELLKQLSIKRWLLIMCVALLSSCDYNAKLSTGCNVKEVDGCTYVVCVYGKDGIAMSHAANCKNHDISGNH